MKSKQAKANFFKLSSSKESNLELFNNKIKEMYSNFQNKIYDNVPTLDINDLQYYISAMRRIDSDEVVNGERLYCVVMTISRVDTKSQILLANLENSIDSRKREVEHGENEGLVVDTRVLFDPFRQIIIVYNQRGTINNYDLQRFFCKIIGVRGLKFDIILNKEAMRRLDNLDVIKSISYTVASPDNFKTYRDDDRSESGDFKFANSISGESMKVTIASSSLTKVGIKDKIKELFSDGNLEVRSATVDGWNDGIQEPIDLIRNKLKYIGWINYEQVMDDEAVYGFLTTAYDCHYDYLKSIYNVRFEV
ncbi:hypothetical protein KQ224_04970 [Streptococcus parasuis]|uniref:hypothetical protein n=1 Tax=Streptococcus parasuis TaxID=1501662 RepID=UPI001C1FE61E|nr:hypothetical protein [Streptococcus parasuis]QWV87430.1 hypothetical protein KQ224_04970 [Streptococcus parasuis]